MLQYRLLVAEQFGQYLEAPLLGNKGLAHLKPLSMRENLQSGGAMRLYESTIGAEVVLKHNLQQVASLVFFVAFLGSLIVHNPSFT